MFDWARGFSYASACNVQRVKKSVTGYLSKYISKGRGLAPEAGIAFPRQWWGMTDSIRELISQQTEDGSIEVYRNTFSWYATLERFLNLAGLIFADLYVLDSGMPVCLYGRLAAVARGSPQEIIDYLTWEAARERLTRSGWSAQQPTPA